MIGPGEAEDGFEVDQETGHQMLDCCVQCLRENPPSPLTRTRLQSFTAADRAQAAAHPSDPGNLPPLRSAIKMRRQAPQCSVPLVAVGRDTPSSARWGHVARSIIQVA